MTHPRLVVHRHDVTVVDVLMHEDHAPSVRVLVGGPKAEPEPHVLAPMFHARPEPLEVPRVEAEVRLARAADRQQQRRLRTPEGRAEAQAELLDALRTRPRRA